MAIELKIPLTIERKHASADRLEVPVTASTDAPLRQELFIGGEYLDRVVTLRHDAESVDLESARGDGVPIHRMHWRDLPLGRLVNPTLDGGSMKGTLRFSRGDAGRQLYQDALDGILTDVSVGAQIERYEDDGESLTATRWKPFEVSLVDVGLDPRSGLFRSKTKSGDHPMAEEHDGKNAGEKGGEKSAVVDLSTITRDYEVAKQAGANAAVMAERKRLADIDEIFANPMVPRDDFMTALRVRAIDDGWDELATRRIVMDALSGQSAPAVDHSQHDDRKQTTLYQSPAVSRAAPSNERRPLAQPVQAGTDELEKFAEIATKVICMRAGIASAEEVTEARTSGYADMGLLRMGQLFLTRRGQGDKASGLGNEELADLLLQRTGTPIRIYRAGPATHSDFTAILANVATKAALKGWEEAGATWQTWCNTGSLPDFKQATIAGLGAFPDLDQIPASGGPYKYAGMADQYETAALLTYGKLFGISRRALIDDDLNAFTRTPMKMGLAASRKVNSLAYTVLTGNQTMTYDSTALFHADHSNYIASGSGAAPSKTTLDTALASMRKQTAPVPSGDSSNAYLNVVPQYLIVPPDIEGTSWDLLNSTYDPAGTTSSISRRDAPNRWKGSLTLVVDPLVSPTSGWFLAAPQNAMIDTVTMFFLNGASTPMLEEMDAGTNDGRTFKVRIDAVARALDHRGLYFNYGA